VVATALVPEAQRGRAVAIVLAGLTVSNIVGVPAGTAIGQIFGWRATFWAMFALGIVAVIAMIALLPRTTGAARRTAGLLGEIRVLGRQQVWTSLIIMLMLMMSQFVPYTFITPFLTEVSGIDASLVPFVLLLNGVGATIGVLVGGRLADWRLMPALIALLAFQSLVMAAMYVLSPYAWPMVAVVALWGCTSFIVGTPIQARILGWTADAPNLASSLIPSGFNFGIALASFIGATMLDAGYGYRSLTIIGIFSMLIGAVVAALSWSAEKRAGLTPPQPVTVG